jgi:hypothetical protein
LYNNKKVPSFYTQDLVGLWLDCIFYPLQLMQSGLSNEQVFSCTKSVVKSSATGVDVGVETDIDDGVDDGVSGTVVVAVTTIASVFIDATSATTGAASYCLSTVNLIADAAGFVLK